MHRFFETDISGIKIGDLIALGAENAFHARSAARLRPGEALIICDGRATDYSCVLEAADKSAVTARVTEISQNTAEPRAARVLFQALPKGDKMDFIIQKCVELGVTEIIPVITEFTASRPDAKGAEAKLRRHGKISEAAAKQSGRGIIPRVAPVCALGEAIGMFAGLDRVFAAYEREKNTTLKAALKGFKGQSAGFFVGAEGGFSEKEIALLAENGAAPVSLGTRILRAETAGMYMLSCVDYEFSEE